jgi:hypothetical protein
MKPIIERFSTEWPPEESPLFGTKKNLVEIDDIPRILGKSDLERSWKNFIGWIGFSELVKSIKRKDLSIRQTSLRLLAEDIFSIEIGLSKILKRWSTFRRLLYPKDSSIYNAYSFVQTCMALKKELSEMEADRLRKRVIGNLLPSGRLADIDLELQIWRSLGRGAGNISHFGILGSPGPDFIFSSGRFDIEIEGKCISPETGMPLSYGLVSSLLNATSDHLKGRYPGQFVSIEAEVKNTHSNVRSVQDFKSQIEETYASGQGIITRELMTKIEFRPLAQVTAEFGPLDDNLQNVFGKYRRQYGDFGLFAGNQSECVFLNLIPLAPRKTLKKMMKIISEAGEQFSKTRPAILWLHLLGMPDSQSASEDEDMIDLFDRLLGHAFSPKRDHISIVIFSSDMRLIDRKALGYSKLVRAADGKNHKRFYANPHTRFPLTRNPDNASQ